MFRPWMLLLATAAVLYAITKGCSKRGKKKQSGETEREAERGRDEKRGSCQEGGLLRSSLSSANPAGTAARHMASGSSLLSASSLGIHKRKYTHIHTLPHTHTQLTLLWCSTQLLPEQKGTGLMMRCLPRG